MVYQPAEHLFLVVHFTQPVAHLLAEGIVLLFGFLQPLLSGKQKLFTLLNLLPLPDAMLQVLRVDLLLRLLHLNDLRLLLLDLVDQTLDVFQPPQFLLLYLLLQASRRLELHLGLQGNYLEILLLFFQQILFLNALRCEGPNIIRNLLSLCCQLRPIRLQFLTLLLLLVDDTQAVFQNLI